MKQIFISIAILLSFSKIYSQEITETATITKFSDNIDPNFDNFRRFENNLDTKKIDYINPEQAYSKTFVFIGNKKVFYQENYPAEKVKLTNHSIKDSNFESVLKKEVFTVEIKKQSLFLKSLKNKTQLILKIDKSGEYIKLINEKTKDIYVALEKKTSQKK